MNLLLDGCGNHWFEIPLFLRPSQTYWESNNLTLWICSQTDLAGQGPYSIIRATFTNLFEIQYLSFINLLPDSFGGTCPYYTILTTFADLLEIPKPCRYVASFVFTHSGGRDWSLSKSKHVDKSPCWEETSPSGKVSIVYTSLLRGTRALSTSQYIDIINLWDGRFLLNTCVLRRT